MARTDVHAAARPALACSGSEDRGQVRGQAPDAIG
jgi:hypothetical protein